MLEIYKNKTLRFSSHRPDLDGDAEGMEDDNSDADAEGKRFKVSDGGNTFGFAICPAKVRLLVAQAKSLPDGSYNVPASVACDDSVCAVACVNFKTVQNSYST